MKGKGREGEDGKKEEEANKHKPARLRWQLSPTTYPTLPLVDRPLSSEGDSVPDN